MTIHGTCNISFDSFLANKVNYNVAYSLGHLSAKKKNNNNMTWIKTEKISLFNIMTMKFKLGFKKKVKFGYGIKQKKNQPSNCQIFFS